MGGLEVPDGPGLESWAATVKRRTFMLKQTGFL